MKGFKSYSLNKDTDRHTHSDATENITYPYTRVVNIDRKPYLAITELF